MKSGEIGCPKCGSTKGFYGNIRGVQTYFADGYPSEAYTVGKPTKSISCFDCGYRTTADRLKERAKKHETT